MPSQYDETDFIDRDYHATQQTAYAPGPASAPRAAAAQAAATRPPTPEELDHRVSETQQRLAELKRAQEALEKERAALEEARRRRTELQTGREEMIEHLTRGIGLLEEAAFAARRDAEQMGKSLDDFKAALGKVQAIREETWTEDNYNTELTRALTTIENARMEWNSARLKWSLLNGAGGAAADGGPADAASLGQSLSAQRMTDLCRVGLALNWPLALVNLVALLVFLYLVLNR